MNVQLLFISRQVFKQLSKVIYIMIKITRSQVKNNMENILIQHWIEFLFTSIGGYFIYVIKDYKQKQEAAMAANIEYQKKQQQEYEAIKNGVRVLLKDRLTQGYNYHNDRGFCPVPERNNLEDIYMTYHSLGGNGTGTVLYEKIQEMPTVLFEETN